jgi:hypothetical protein
MTQTAFSDEQRIFFEKRTKEATDSKPWLSNLHEKLLSMGGSNVVLWNGSNEEEFVKLLLEDGHLYSVKNIGLRKGEENNCHENAQRWAKQRPDWFNYATGYALAKEIWRPHSWLFNPKKQRVTETTVKQEKYFGFDYPLE